MNHVICIRLFGKQESQELILESWNQAKIPKDSESRRRKFAVADPSGNPVQVLLIQRLIHSNRSVPDQLVVSRALKQGKKWLNRAVARLN